MPVEDQLSVVSGIRDGCLVVVVCGDLVADTVARRAFGHPAIVCPAGRVSKVLEIVHAHRLVPIYADLQAALVSLTA